MNSVVNVRSHRASEAEVDGRGQIAEGWGLSHQIKEKNDK